MRVDLPYDDAGWKVIDEKRFGVGFRGKVREVLMREGLLPFPGNERCANGKGIVYTFGDDTYIIAHEGMHDATYAEAIPLTAQRPSP